MTDRHNDLSREFESMQPPLPWQAALRETELGQIARNLTAAMNEVSEAAARVMIDLSRKLDTVKRTYVTSYEGRRLRRALRALGLIAPLPAPVPRCTAHGRLRSRRERRDIQKARRR